MFTRPLASLCTLLCAASLQAEPRLDILTLQHRSADELLPLLQPLLEADERIAADGQQLLLRAEPARLDELRSLLEQLDVAPRRLLISVDSRRQEQGEQRGYRLDAQAGRDPQAELRVQRFGTRDNAASLQQIQTVEGYPARILIGRSLPVERQARDAYGHPYRYTEQREQQQGFQAIASVRGERVSVRLYSLQDDLVRGRDGSYTNRQSDTLLSGRLGEWIEVAGIRAASAEPGAEVRSRRYDSAAEGLSLRLKIELLE